MYIEPLYSQISEFYLFHYLFAINIQSDFDLH